MHGGATHSSGRVSAKHRFGRVFGGGGGQHYAVRQALCFLQMKRLTTAVDKEAQLHTSCESALGMINCDLSSGTPVRCRGAGARVGTA